MLFCIYLDPEIVQMARVCRAKQAWSAKISREYGKKVITCGGSSCAFSIQGTRMLEQHGLPTVNMGLHAGFGAAMLIRCALEEARPGDTFIVAVEPQLLTKKYQLSSFACKLGCAMGRPKWAYQFWDTSPIPWVDAPLHCNTGWKWLLLFPEIRRNAIAKNHYDLLQGDGSGWQKTSFRPQQYGPLPRYGGHLSEDGRRLLQFVRQWCDQNGVRVAYSLPWEYYVDEDAGEAQRTNGSIIKEIAEVMPVLRDARLGVCEVGYFGDTPYHLTEKTAPIRTDELARQIKNWDVWGPGELEAWVRQHAR